MALFFLTTLLLSLHNLGSAADHFLRPNQTLSIARTLLSQNQDFQLGFFSPGKSSNKYLGIWYKGTPEVVVWVANRNNPITHSQAQGAVFTISEKGNLVISSGESVIWSASPSRPSSDPVVRLLNTGNLVLVDEPSQDYLWQSFHFPTDTLLPGMQIVDDIDAGILRNLTSWRSPDDPSCGDFVHKIKNWGLPEVVILRGSNTRSRLGQWNGMYFNGGPRFPSDLYHPIIEFKEDRMISIGEVYEDTILTRVTLDPSGLILRHTMNARKDKWNLALRFPQDPCDEYGVCGPNSICRTKTNSPVRCQCLKGFSPKLQKDWDLQDWSGGCVRTKPLNYGGGDGFLEVRGVKYPDMLRFWFNKSTSAGECREECLRNWDCTAYAIPFITDGDKGCLMWYGDIIDTKELNAAHSEQNIYVHVARSELDFSALVVKEEGKENKRPMKLIIISMASGVFMSAFINALGVFLARRKREVKWKNGDIELPVIRKAIIVQATNNFSMENMTGIGGFGPVYKGKMPLGEEIAVKRLSKTSTQGLEEFKNEVMVIAKLQHRNLVRLLGCCIEEEERMLIYEYLQNKSLDYFVFGNL